MTAGSRAIWSLLGRMSAIVRRDPDRFLRHVRGVIHVGANTGQERGLYAVRRLPVIWIEPIPEVFERLAANIERYPGQRAYQYLVTDQDAAECQFHIANNMGESSSILDLARHRDIWPHVWYERTITLRSITLASLLRHEGIDRSAYDALIMDTQGSELLVLKGAVPILRHFAYVKTEVADFESYAGCCQLGDIASFLAAHGFVEHSRLRIKHRADVGSYYNVVYRRAR
jgi:FkbM family methyltransferase